jgi:hypothetical protein
MGISSEDWKSPDGALEDDPAARPPVSSLTIACFENQQTPVLDFQWGRRRTSILAESSATALASGAAFASAAALD